VRPLHTISLGARRACRVLLATALSLLAVSASADAFAGAPTHATPLLRAAQPGVVAHGSTCSGTAEAPGVLAGKYFGNVTISGECLVDEGEAVVEGNLVVGEGSSLIAAFGLNDLTHRNLSRLIVHGSVRVRPGASLLMGCEPMYFPCLDDPDPENATLSSSGLVYGTVSSHEALGVVLHNSTIDGNVLQSGGGGGLQCVPEGVFEEFPVYSDYEDLTINGHLEVKDLESCWLGIARVHLSGRLDLIGDQLADPDAIEILSNQIGGNLDCRNDSQVWDTVDLTEELYPRGPRPNTVIGQRAGQCVLASPAYEGGPLGPGAF
jgi:hypothetical protein